MLKKLVLLFAIFALAMSFTEQQLREHEYQRRLAVRYLQQKIQQDPRVMGDLLGTVTSLASSLPIVGGLLGAGAGAGAGAGLNLNIGLGLGAGAEAGAGAGVLGGLLG